MPLQIKTMTGEFPRTLPHMLPDSASQDAVDCDFSTGVLMGLKGDLTTSVAAGKSLFVFDADTANYFVWPYEVDAVRGPIANDAYQRFYWTDGSELYVSRGSIGAGGEPSGSNKVKAGVPRPTMTLTQGVVEAVFPLPLSIDAQSYAGPLVRAADGADAGYSAAITNPTTVSNSATELVLSGTGTFSWNLSRTIDPASLGVSLAVNDVAWSGSKYVAVGNAGAIYTSADGKLWTKQDSKKITSNLKAVVWSGSLFVAVGTGGQVMTSPDGIAWTKRSAGSKDLNGVAYASSKLVAVGNAGALYVSADGASWSSKTSGVGSANDLMAVAWNGSRFVAAGRNGVSTSSTDGATANTWAANAAIAGTPTIYDLIHDGAKLVGVGSGSCVVTSTTGTSWTVQVAPSGTAAWYDITWTGSTYMAVGTAGAAKTSANLTVWTDAVAEVDADLFVALWANSQYLVAGDAGAVKVSPDAATWTATYYPVETILAPITGKVDKSGYPTAWSEVRPSVAIKLPSGMLVMREIANKSTFPAGFEAYGGSLAITNVRTDSVTPADSKNAPTVVTSAFDYTITLWVTASQSFVETVVYAFTLVNDFGEEGGPSDAFTVELPQGATPNLRIPAGAVPAGYRQITKARVYRSATGASATQLLYCKEVAYTGAADAVVTDDSAGESLVEPLSTLNFYPPESGLNGLCYMGGGVFAAFKGNEVHFCEPYLPYAWNPANIINTGTQVAGICPCEGGLFVTTKAQPYYITGLTPGEMGQTRVTAVQAGVGQRSICNFGPAVVYASHDGLVMARGLDVSLEYSFKFFTRDEWRSRYGSKLGQMRINAHDGHLLVWFTDGTPGFFMRYDEAEASLAKLSEGYTAAAVYPVGDALYVLPWGGAYFKEFRAAMSRRGFSWWSKDFILPAPAAFGCLQLIGQGSATVTIYADGVAVHSATYAINDAGTSVFRLPSGFKARRWSVKVVCAATHSVAEINLARSPMELRNG